MTAPWLTITISRPAYRSRKASIAAIARRRTSSRLSPPAGFHRQTKNAPDNLAGLLGAQEVTGNQHLGAELAGEAECEFPRLKASGIGQRDVIGIGKASQHICRRLAMTDQDDFASLRPFHDFYVYRPSVLSCCFSPFIRLRYLQMAITRRQKEVLDFIASWQVENGYSPSYEEIARGLNLASIATVHKHISALDKKNYLQRSHNQSRSIDVAPRYLQEQRRNRLEASLEVPVLGSIAAGQPVEPYEDRTTVSFADFVGQKDTYALRVRGNSMIEDHICEGDMILVENTPEAREGDIVVALVGGTETTLKRYYREPGNMVRLQPANSAMSPIRVPAQNVQIQGRLLAVLRKY
jgi:repressor LexA